MTAGEIIKKSSLPGGEAEIILAFLLKTEREFLLTHPETPISPAQAKKFRQLRNKRLKNWPIAYLIGKKGFYGLDFKVSPAVLTPRPETELIIEKIIDIVGQDVKRGIKTEGSSSADQAPGPIIIDLGTGSGAIIVTVGAELKRLFPANFYKVKLVAVDISGAALKIARQNAGNYGLTNKIKFYRGNLLTPIKPILKKITGRELIIAANLPYLTLKQIKKSPSISREPKLALAGGRDGLEYYRKLFRQLSIFGLSAGAKIRVLCEIDPGQTKKMKELIKKYFPATRNEIKKDLAGHDRLITSRI